MNGGSPDADRRSARAGLGFGIGAYVLWGAFPGFFPLLRPAGTLEILAARIVWSLVVMGLIVLATRKAGRVRQVLTDRRALRWLTVGAVFVALNWGVYIAGVLAHRVVETSLGYFINPLVTILLGVFVLGERLRRIQWVAVSIATAAIVVLTFGYGHVPWIGLVLAVSFGIYGLAKKRARVDAVSSLTVETLVLTPFALLTMLALGLTGGLTFATRGPDHALLLVLCGLVTTVPLLLFGAATRRLPLSTVGLLQYLTPIMQFGYGVFVDRESLSTTRLVGFGLVWLALVVLVADGWRRSRTTRREARPDVLDPTATAA